ncbi:MAG: ABC transporter permease [Eubacterium sp.]|nr:ABC transporter permease [Eubacterium sp.]
MGKEVGTGMILVWFELKKIFAKQMNRTALFLLAGIVCMTGFLTIREVRYYEEGGTVVYGAAAARRLKAEKKEWEGSVTGEVLRRTIVEIRKINAASCHQDEAFVKKQGLSDLEDMINEGCSKQGQYDYYLAGHISPGLAARLYETRILMLKEMLGSSQNQSLTDQKKAFLLRRYESLKTPLFYEYADGWKALLDSQYLPTLMILTIVILGFFVSGIFPDEFHMKTDDVFFASCLGRSRAVAAKAAAGFLTVTAVYWSVMLAFTAIVLGALGTGGAGCMVQTGFGNWDSIYNITYAQDWLFSMCGGYAGHLFILTFAMLLSVKSRSAVIAVAVPFVMSCIPMFLARIPYFAPVMQLFPDMLLRINKFLDHWYLIQIGGKVYGSFVVLLFVYLALFFVLVPMLYHSFRKIA